MESNDWSKKLAELRDKVLDIALAEQSDQGNELESAEAKKEKTKQQFNEAYDAYLKRLQHGYELIMQGIEKQLNK